MPRPPDSDDDQHEQVHGRASASASDHGHEADLTAEYETPDLAHTVARSVGVEVGEIEGDRTHATVERDGQTVRVRVTAADLVALRAGVNTWGTLLAVAERTAGAAAGT